MGRWASWCGILACAFACGACDGSVTERLSSGEGDAGAESATSPSGVETGAEGRGGATGATGATGLSLPAQPEGGAGAATTSAHGSIRASSAAVGDAASNGEASTALAYDGTTGKPCTRDSDCSAPGRPGVARCSNSVFGADDYYPTPVCVLPSCPTPSGPSGLHYCDGPDAPTSPGICIALGVAGASAATCVPKCAYDTKGDPAVGCAGKDTCRVDTEAAEAGEGYCWGGCRSDTDCESGQHCQADHGTCLAEVVPPTKTVGEACTTTDSDDYACRCFYGSTTDSGYCSSFCIVGDASMCPTGYVCDALEWRYDGYSAQTEGMAGWCVATCGRGADAGACPANSSCTDVSVAGPDCSVH